MIIYGRNAVREALKAGKVVTLHALGRLGKDEVVSLARANQIQVKLADESSLTKMAKNPSHQGFVAICQDIEPVSLDALIQKASQSKYPLLLMLDGIEDPHNLGAILRSADALGVDGIIIKNRGEAPLNSTVAKVSTGAICWVDVCAVTNLNQAIEKLKLKGYWVVASDGEARQSYDEVDYRCPIVLIVGSEGFGISRLVLKNSDFIVKIPMVGHVNSLNASVSSAILLAQIALSRK
ncbi:MAG: 23S rRNA (guanosine(2251)-2'-O)-methyltransferase RlmB [Bacillota bacterium]|nr:23S rRNA (guanosine(2251)-2'-O)-methyltransferase RlmB [Bacillota bacterium]